MDVLEEAMEQCPQSPNLPRLRQMRTGLAGIAASCSHDQQLNAICRVYGLHREVTEDRGIVEAFTNILLQKMPAYSPGINPSSTTYQPI